MEFINFDKEEDKKDIEYIINAFSAGIIKSGESISVRGTLHRIKDMSGFKFVNIRGQRRVFQCVWSAEQAKCDLNDFSLEECIMIDGIVVAEERSRLGFDIHILDMKRLSGKAAQLPIEISNDKIIDKLNLNTLLSNRIITLRNPKVRSIIRVVDGVMYAFRDFLRKEGFVEFVPPKIVSSGAEGGADMFQVDYFGKKAFLNQSPQMYKQTMVAVFNKVFTVGPVFRAEKYSTNRHINEFQGLDLEMGFIDSYIDLIALETRMIRYIVNVLNTEYEQELDIVLGKGHRLPEIKKVILIKFTEAKELYAKGNQGEIGEKALKEADFAPDEEQWLGNYFLEKYNSPLVFVTHYPSIKRPFYAMDDPEDPNYTLSYDLLLNGMEVTTGGQRIHDYDEQVAKMLKRGMSIDDFEDYLTMHKYGMPPHGGMGLGLERIVENLLGLSNVKLATAFPRDRDRIRP